MRALRIPLPDPGRAARKRCARATPLLLRALLPLASALLLAGQAPPRYETVAGEDWTRYRSVDELRRAGGFWWWREGEDVYRDVALVPDATFGQVARITFRQSEQTGYAPKLNRSFAPLDRMWFRWRMRFSPGWTTVGPLPPGYANSYKVAFWLWEGYEGRGQVEITNTDEYQTGFGVLRPGGEWLRYQERHLPGHREFGRVAGEWSDGQWYEFVVLYERTGPASARQHWWRRRLTSGGAIAPGPWTYSGIEVSGAPVPRVRAITLGANRNRSNPRTMHIDWGPWEVVDGSRFANPFQMPLLP